MLAYLFWHRPIPDAVEYAAALRAFHVALRAASPPGFRGCAAFAVNAPWCEGYEDWYLVDDWAALGTLNERAPQVAEHASVAAMADWGAGGVYRLLHGEAALDAPSAAWSSKPPGISYEAFQASLPERSVWQRQLVLGPAPEFCLPGEPGVQRTAVA